jgi:hypothetical protein
MLDSRSWPYPPIDTTESNNNGTTMMYRDSFCNHYTVLRDIKALRYGLDALSDARNVVVTSSKEMTYRKFSTKPHAPKPPNRCIGIQQWSPNRMIVAYDLDCTIRLYETQGDTICKEIICQKIDPYRHTKKRTCRLVSFDLDEQCIACLGRVTGSPNNPTVAYVLLVMSRDDYLLGDTNDTTVAGSTCGYSEDMSKVTVIDIGAAVFHYLISFDEGDHRLLELTDYLEQGGTIGDVDITPSPTIGACGYGRFMLEIKISIPNDIMMINADVLTDDTYRLIDRKLFLFSSTIGAIVWSYESNPISYSLLPSEYDMNVTCLRRPIPGGNSRQTCLFAVRGPMPFTILVGEIEPSGTVEYIRVLPSSCSEIHEALSLNVGWRLNTSSQYLAPTILTESHVIAAHSIVQCLPETNHISAWKTILTFSNRNEYNPPIVDVEANDCIVDSLSISGDLEVVRISLIRDQYIALMCRTCGQPDLLDITWHERYFVAIIVHVPSQNEVCRTELCGVRDGCNDITLAPYITYDCNETIGLCLSWEGVVMSGHDVRKTIESTLSSSLKQKKKPSLRNNQGYKKDGFRLGKK